MVLVYALNPRDGGEGAFAPRPCQNPAAKKTRAHPAVKSIKKGDGSINHAATAAAADKPPHR